MVRLLLIRPDAIFIRPAVKLIPAHTKDILEFFKQYSPQWVGFLPFFLVTTSANTSLTFGFWWRLHLVVQVEWMKATFIVVFNDAAMAQKVLSDFTVKVPDQLPAEEGQEQEKVSTIILYFGVASLLILCTGDVSLRLISILKLDGGLFSNQSSTRLLAGGQLGRARRRGCLPAWFVVHIRPSRGYDGFPRAQVASICNCLFMRLLLRTI